MTPPGLAALRQRVTLQRRRLLAPPPKLTVSEWADKYRHVPSYSAEAGPWVTARTPYLREIMDSFNEPGVNRVVFQKCARIGATEAGLNIVGYYIHHDPSTIMIVQPTVDDAKDFSKEQLAPTIADTPVLRERVSEAVKDSKNTITAKALALDTPLPTPHGWSTVGDIAVGESVFGADGLPCRVLAKTPVFADHECYRVTFSDGSSIVADGGHLWAVEWWQTEKIEGRVQQVRNFGTRTTRDMLPKVRQGNRYRFSVKNARPVETGHVDLPIDPYVLGVWLGDGNSDSTRIAAHVDDVDEMIAHVEACGHETLKRFGHTNTWTFIIDPQVPMATVGSSGRFTSSAVGLRWELGKLGLLRKAGTGPSKKHIPPMYLRASREQRISLLQGLMDTDGTVTKTGDAAKFSSVIPALCEGFGELLSSLGIANRGRWRPSFLSIKGVRTRTKDSMQFSFALTPDMDVFRLARKRARQGLRKPQSVRGKYRRIVSIEPVDSVPVQCITVDNASHLFLAGRSMVPTHNCFPGGSVVLGGANSPRFFRRRTVRVLILEEINGYGGSASARKEGSQIKLAEKRTETLGYRRKIYLNSTPTTKGECEISEQFARSDQRFFHVPCPECKVGQRLEWERLRYKDRATPAYECVNCGALIEEEHKDAMVQQGEWIVTQPMRTTRGYHINALYSPFVRWSVLVEEWVSAQGDPEALRVFVNTALGEAWEDREAQDVQDTVRARAKQYEPEGATWRVPRGACVLVCGVDKQDAELHYVVRAYGPGEQSWLIEWGIFRGDTSQPKVWAELDTWRLTRVWQHEGGAPMTIRAMCIDSGDDPAPVYAFTKARLADYVFAIKGAADPNADILPRRWTKTSAKSRLYVIGTQAIKKRLLRRVGMIAPEPYTLDCGAGFMHVNARGDAVYFAEFFSQKLVRHEYRGKTVTMYVKRAGERDEKMDCEVYAYAALKLGPVSEAALQSEWERVMAEGESVAEGSDSAKAEPVAAPAASSWMGRRSGSWMGRVR